MVTQTLDLNERRCDEEKSRMKVVIIDHLSHVHIVCTQYWHFSFFTRSMGEESTKKHTKYFQSFFSRTHVRMTRKLKILRNSCPIIHILNSDQHGHGHTTLKYYSCKSSKKLRKKESLLCPFLVFNSLSQGLHLDPRVSQSSQCSLSTMSRLISGSDQTWQSRVLRRF